jgi:hypothetical protein
VPVDGEDVEILAGVNMIYDVAVSPILNTLVINGRLTFENNKKDLHLRANNIYVQKGELIIGTDQQAFSKNAKITLYGNKDENYIAFANSVEAGNKLLLNTGRIQIYGDKRKYPTTRMLYEAYPGDTIIYVESNLDWQVGEMIGIAPSTMRYNDSDTAKIVDYDSKNGIIKLDRPLRGYHYGFGKKNSKYNADDDKDKGKSPKIPRLSPDKKLKGRKLDPEGNGSTSKDYNGVDMRNEVYLLSRNVKISGVNTDGWGCQIATSDYTEESGRVRAGQTFMEGVEIYNCSQYDTTKAALRFEGSNGGWS